MTTFFIAGLTGLGFTALIIFALTRLRVQAIDPKILFGAVAVLTLILLVILGISVLGKFARPDTWLREWSFSAADSRVGQLLLGGVFGVVLGYWTSLLLQPNAVFYPPAVRRAHNIWGIVLVVILGLGIMLPYQAELMDSVQGVSTPAFEITFQSNQSALLLRAQVGSYLNSFPHLAVQI